MTCDKCGRSIGEEPGTPIYQVRLGFIGEDGDFEPDTDIGYYCSECLAKGT